MWCDAPRRKRSQPFRERTFFRGAKDDFDQAFPRDDHDAERRATMWCDAPRRKRSQPFRERTFFRGAKDDYQGEAVILAEAKPPPSQALPGTELLERLCLS